MCCICDSEFWIFFQTFWMGSFVKSVKHSICLIPANPTQYFFLWLLNLCPMWFLVVACFVFSVERACSNTLWFFVCVFCFFNCTPYRFCVVKLQPNISLLVVHGAFSKYSRSCITSITKQLAPFTSFNHFLWSDKPQFVSVYGQSLLTSPALNKDHFFELVHSVIDSYEHKL